MYDSWNNYHIILLALAFPKSGLRFFCAFNITGDIKSLVQISILLNKSKIVEIWKKFFISRAILKAQKRQTTFWKWQDKGNFVIIISGNLLLKLGWKINAANYIKNQDDIQVVLHTVMFRGTPCMCYKGENPQKKLRRTEARRRHALTLFSILFCPTFNPRLNPKQM